MADFLKSSAVVIQDKKMLMVKDYNKSYLGMLGGTIEQGETLIESLKREIIEEIGVTNFEILDSEPFYSAKAPAGSDLSKTVEIHCFKVILNQTPMPTYNKNNQKRVDAGFNISEIHWIGINELEVIKEYSKPFYKLNKNVKDDEGNTLTLTPITEEFIFPELIRLKLI